MELRELEMFLALVETMHFGRAADRLGCTQPALSRGIRKLEEDLDTQLFVRDSRNVRLTPAGERFREGAADVVDRAGRARRAAQEGASAYVERLVLGVCLCGQHDRIGELIAAYRVEADDAPVSLVSVSEPEIPTALAEGTVHALVAVEWAFPAGCQRRPLLETALEVVLPESNPLSDQELITPRDLDGAEVVLPSRREHPMIAEYFREFCLEHGIKPRTVVEADTLAQVMGVVAGQAALAIMPLPSGYILPRAVVRPLSIHYPLRYLLGWRRSTPLTARLEAALRRLG